MSDYDEYEALAAEVERQNRQEVARRMEEFHAVQDRIDTEGIDDSWMTPRPAAAPLPQDLSKATNEDLLRHAHSSLNPDADKLSLEDAKRLGGPKNEYVREMIMRGLVVGVEAPRSRDEQLLSDPRTREKALKIKADLDAKAAAQQLADEKRISKIRAEREKKKISFEAASQIPWNERRELIAKGLVEGVKNPSTT